MIHLYLMSTRPTNYNRLICNLNLGRDEQDLAIIWILGLVVVRMIPFYSDDPNSNPTEDYFL